MRPAFRAWRNFKVPRPTLTGGPFFKTIQSEETSGPERSGPSKSKNTQSMKSIKTPSKTSHPRAFTLLAALSLVAGTSEAAPVAIPNSSFESDVNTDPTFAGRFSYGEAEDFGGSLTNWTTVTTENTPAGNGKEVSVGFIDIAPANGAQVLALMAGASIKQVTFLPWSNLSAGDTITLTVAVGDRTNAGAPNWADQSFFAITDGDTSGPLADGTLLSTTVANSGELATPFTSGGINGGTMEDRIITYTVVPGDLSRTGNVGVLLAGFGVAGSEANGLGSSSNQSFFDNVRLEYTFVDTDSDNLPDGYEDSFVGISPAGDFNVTGLPSLSGLGGADFDGDGLTDLAEYLGFDGNPYTGDESRPDKNDTDDDDLNDFAEVNGSANIWTGTTAGSAPGDSTNPNNPDSDEDGILDGEEVIAGIDGFITNPALADSDGDGMTDTYEVLNNLLGGLDPTDLADASGDLDGDGIINLVESTGIAPRPATRADKADTDGDGYDDLAETNTGIWFSDADTGSNPTLEDTDGDGLLDGQENPDTGTASASPYNSDPNRRDSDYDGYSDNSEVAALTDPALNTSYPASPLVITGSAVKNFGTTFAQGVLRRFTNADKGKTFRVSGTAGNSAFAPGLGADDWIGASLNPNTGSGTGVSSANDNGMGFLARSPNLINSHQVFDTSAGAAVAVQGSGGFTETQDAGTGNVSFDFTFTLSPDYDTTGQVSFSLTITDDGPNSPYSTSGNFLSNNGAGGNLDLYLENQVGTVGAVDFAASLSEVFAGSNLKINSVAFDGTNFTINFTGDPNTSYNIASDPDLSSGFATIVTTVTTDGSGNGSETFLVGANRFFRVQTQ